MNNDTKLQNSPINVKAPFASRSVCIEAAKADPICIQLGGFTLIKNHGYYDYAHGKKNILMSDDIPQADYWLNLNGEWRHRARTK